MYWTVFFVVSLIFLLASIIFAVIRSKTKYKSGRIIEPLNIIFAGVIVSSVILFIPIYMNTFKNNECGMVETVLIAVHNMIRLFIVDGDFSFITSNVLGLSEWLYRAYTLLFSVLFVVSPILTFGFVLSFFKNISAYQRYFRHYKSNVYVFSELNDKSLALATDLYKNNPKERFFVFTDVFEKGEQSFELIEKAKELGAVCFKKDIVAIDFSFHSKKSELNFFTIGEDHSENIVQTLKLIETFKYRENTNMYVFSTQEETELLVANAFNEPKEENEKSSIKIKVRRINEVLSLVSRNLYEVGYEKIFKSAYQTDDGEKNISAVIVGMGRHGTEMTKALSWFCQMDGYHAEINAFDILSNAEDVFKSGCPELMDERFNGKFDIDGEARYKITIHSGIDANTKTFDDKVLALSCVSYVFVALGTDEMNISTAIKLRSLFAKAGMHPEIQAVIYNSDKKDALKNITNFKKQKYDIDFIGDLQESYSEAVILRSDIESAALKRHLRWGEEDDFWKYGYNYKSSIASAIHLKMKIACGMPGIEKTIDERTEEEKNRLRKLEHCRWNAYMRSEGYCFADKRDDLAKTHNCLIPFDDLPEKEKIKDDD